MGRKLYVGNFPYETGEAELQDLFARAGTVETLTVMRDMATGRARGFAFVEMSSDDEAQKAIADLNAYQLGGRSRRMPEGSAANRRVAPSRVGNPEQGRHEIGDGRMTGTIRTLRVDKGF